MRRFKSQRLLRLLLLTLFLLSSFFLESSHAFDQSVLNAIQAMAQNNATQQQQALLFKNNKAVNAMRIKGFISDMVYQVCQRHYAQTNFEIASRAAADQGVNLTVQNRAAGHPYDAGTDSDYIGDAKTADQVKRIQDGYNRYVDQYLSSNDVPAGDQVNWLKQNDVDIMADPEGISKQEFEKIAKLNNDAYTRPDAAAYERKSRPGSNEPPTTKEILAYQDEMRDFVDKKTGEINRLSGQLQEINRQPDARIAGTDASKERLQLEADVQLRQAQKSKYFQRGQDATAALARQGSVMIPDASDLPSQGKTRGPSLYEGPQHRQITSASTDAATAHLKNQSVMNEARVMAVIGANDPTQAKAMQERIAKTVQDLPPSQKGELIAMMRDAPCINDEFTRNVNQKMKTTTPEAFQVPKASALQRAGSLAGIAGDFMSIKDSLEKVENGEHLFFSIEDGDSNTAKNMKRVAAAALELSPVPVIDAMERGWKFDQTEKEYILKQIRLGSAPNPFGSFVRVTGNIVKETVMSMTIDPLLAGKTAIEEGGMATNDIFQNWQDDDIREASLKYQGEKFDDIIKRMEFMEMGIITARIDEFKGPLLIGTVSEGDVLAFEIPRSKKWTGQYDTLWEIIDTRQTVLFRTKRVAANEPLGHRLLYSIPALQPGTYKAVFRIFNKQTQKQMDSSAKDFEISGEIGMTPIFATVKDYSGTPLGKTAKIGDILAFQVRPKGTWDDKHTIEWLINGDSYKTKKASDPKIHRFRFGTDHLDPGFYTVAVRAVDNGDGKIIAHENFRFTLKDKKNPDDPQEPKSTDTPPPLKNPNPAKSPESSSASTGESKKQINTRQQKQTGSGTSSDISSKQDAWTAKMELGVQRINAFELSIREQLYPDCLGDFKAKAIQDLKQGQPKDFDDWRKLHTNHQGYYKNDYLRKFSEPDSKILSDFKATEIGKLLETIKNQAGYLAWDDCTATYVDNALRIGQQYDVPHWSSFTDSIKEDLKKLFQKTKKKESPENTQLANKRAAELENLLLDLIPPELIQMKAQVRNRSKKLGSLSTEEWKTYKRSEQLKIKKQLINILKSGGSKNNELHSAVILKLMKYGLLSKQEFNDLYNNNTPQKKQKEEYEPKPGEEAHFGPGIVYTISVLEQKLKPLLPLNNKFIQYQKKAMVEYRALQQQMAQAKSNGNIKLHNRLAIRHNTMVKEERRMFKENRIVEYNRLIKYKSDISVLVSENKWEKIHEYIQSSGLGTEVNYNPPGPLKE